MVASFEFISSLRESRSARSSSISIDFKLNPPLFDVVASDDDDESPVDAAAPSF
jgi:hypothetical protein